MRWSRRPTPRRQKKPKIRRPRRRHERAAAEGNRGLPGHRHRPRRGGALDAARGAAPRRIALPGGEGGAPLARRRAGRETSHRGGQGPGRRARRAEEGPCTAQAPILAHSMGMPAVMGCAGALEKIPPGTVLVLDGTRGTVLLDPTPAEITDAQGREQRRRALTAQLEEVVAQPSVTADGVRIVLMGNVDLPDELKAAQAHRAAGG